MIKFFEKAFYCTKIGSLILLNMPFKVPALMSNFPADAQITSQNDKKLMLKLAAPSLYDLIPRFLKPNEDHRVVVREIKLLIDFALTQWQQTNTGTGVIKDKKPSNPVLKQRLQQSLRKEFERLDGGTAKDKGNLRNLMAAHHWAAFFMHRFLYDHFQVLVLKNNEIHNTLFMQDAQKACADLKTFSTIDEIVTYSNG